MSYIACYAALLLTMYDECYRVRESRDGQSSVVRSARHDCSVVRHFKVHDDSGSRYVATVLHLLMDSGRRPSFISKGSRTVPDDGHNMMSRFRYFY